MSISNHIITRLKTVSQKLVITAAYTAMLLTLITSAFIPTNAEASMLANSKNNGCTVSSSRPDNSKWILKNKSVSEGVRYTTDVYQANSTNKSNVTYNYLLKDSTSKAQNKVIANFTLNYKLNNNNRWSVNIAGCGPVAKKNKNTLLVSVYNDQTMLRSVRLNGNQKSKAIGFVRKPNANHIRVMNDIDITEEK